MRPFRSGPVTRSRRPTPLRSALTRHRRGRRQGWKELWQPLPPTRGANNRQEETTMVPEVARVLADSAELNRAIAELEAH